MAQKNYQLDYFMGKKTYWGLNCKTISGVGGQRDKKNAGKASIFYMAVWVLLTSVVDLWGKVKKSSSRVKGRL